jgi:hypothetical protein
VCHSARTTNHAKGLRRVGVVPQFDTVIAGHLLRAMKKCSDITETANVRVIPSQLTSAYGRLKCSRPKEGRGWVNQIKILLRVWVCETYSTVRRDTRVRRSDQRIQTGPVSDTSTLAMTSIGATCHPSETKLDRGYYRQHFYCSHTKNSCLYAFTRNDYAYSRTVLALRDTLHSYTFQIHNMYSWRRVSTSGGADGS